MIQGMRALIVADGDVASRVALDAAWPDWDAGIDLVIAADGGYLRALALGLRPDVFVGDGDSLPAADLARLRAEAIELEISSPEKDESDMELALLSALRRGATSVVMLGALGGRRFDHALANVSLLALPALAGRPVELLDGASRLALVTAPGAGGDPVVRPLPGAVGDLVSLLPLDGEVEGVRTIGLAYPLDDEPLMLGPARGLSNVRVHADAAVTVRRGRLLIVESHPVDHEEGRVADARPNPEPATRSMRGAER